jgi:hypothetical protein
MFGPKKDELGVQFRVSRNFVIYTVSNIFRTVKSSNLVWAVHASRMEEARNSYRNVVGKLLEKSPFDRLKKSLEDNIKTDGRDIRDL